MSSMFNEFSAVLQFPYYFGENWNALDECLNDLEWLPADNYVIFITDANHLLVDETPDDFRAIVSALEQAGQEWSDVRGKPFHVVLQAEPPESKQLRQKLQHGGFSCTELFTGPLD